MKYSKQHLNDSTAHGQMSNQRLTMWYAKGSACCFAQRSGSPAASVAVQPKVLQPPSKWDDCTMWTSVTAAPVGLCTWKLDAAAALRAALASSSSVRSSAARAGTD